jgi:hypothetical protein
LPIRFETADSPVTGAVKDVNDPNYRQVRLTATVYVDRGGHFVPDNPYQPIRIENQGVDAKFKSAINGSISVPH